MAEGGTDTLTHMSSLTCLGHSPGITCTWASFRIMANCSLAISHLALKIISIAPPHCIGYSESLSQVQIQGKGQVPSLHEGAERPHWRECEMRGSVVASLEMQLPHNTVHEGTNVIVSVLNAVLLVVGTCSTLSIGDGSQI